MSCGVTDNARLARMCREALGSLHCELTRREKCVLEQIVVYSFELDLDWAVFGSSDQLALEAGLHKTDASSALSSLRRTRLIESQRAAPLRHFRLPMRYRVDVDALIRVARKPTAENPVVAKVRADTAAWLIHANRCYPLQPDLIAPDPNLLELALAEISRASALAQDPYQNAAPKPGVSIAGEVRSAEDEDLPGQALDFAPAPLATAPVDPARARRELHAALQAATGGESALVGESPTTSPPSLRISNYEPRAYQISGYSDGELNSPSGNQIGDARGPVGESQTGFQPSLALEAAMLLSRHGQEWKPPSAAQEVFDELVACMDGAMANYRPWWWPRCVNPETRGDVVEAIATWRLARLSPKHKPWRGGNWRDEFCRRQRARLQRQEATP